MAFDVFLAHLSSYQERCLLSLATASRRQVGVTLLESGGTAGNQYLQVLDLCSNVGRCKREEFSWADCRRPCAKSTELVTLAGVALGEPCAWTGCIAAPPGALPCVVVESLPHQRAKLPRLVCSLGWPCYQAESPTCFRLTCAVKNYFGTAASEGTSEAESSPLTCRRLVSYDAWGSSPGPYDMGCWPFSTWGQRGGRIWSHYDKQTIS